MYKRPEGVKGTVGDEKTTSFDLRGLMGYSS
jgi:hypothetical protein